MDGRRLIADEEEALRARLPALTQDLVDAARTLELEPWAERGLEQDLLFVIEGHGRFFSLDVGRSLGPGGIAVDPLSTTEANQRFSVFRAENHARVVRVPLGERPPVALLDALAEDWEDWFEEMDAKEAVELRSLHDRLNEDGSIKPGPYTLERTRLILVALDRVAWPAKKPLRAIPFAPDCGTLLVIADYPRVLTPGAEAMVYREAALFAPRIVASLRAPTPCVEAGWILPDDRMATLLGRELYGLPKRVGRIDIGADFVSVTHGEPLFRLQWKSLIDLHDAQVGTEAMTALLGRPLRARTPVGLLEWRLPPVLVPSFMAAWRSHPSSTAERSQLARTGMWTRRLRASHRLEGFELLAPPRPTAGSRTRGRALGRLFRFHDVGVRGAWRVEVDLEVADGELL